MANVYKRASGTYWVRFQWCGQEVRKSARTASRSVAQQFLARLLEEHRRLDRGGRQRHTFKEALNRYAVEYMPNLKPASEARYRTSFIKLEGSFGNLYLDEITRGRLADYASERLKGGVKASTVRRDLATLSSLCSCAVAWDWLEINPVRQFGKRHLKEARPQTTYPSVEQVDRLIAASSPAMVGRIIALLSQTGMRMDEVCGLEWSQVSLTRHEIRLTKTKTSSPRVIPLSDDALGTIVGTPRHITSGYVFWHSDGQRYVEFSGVFRKIAVRAKIKCRCHDLRHHFASEFAQRTGDLAALQAILGHKAIAMTMRYSHLVTEHLHRAMRRHAEAGTKVGTRAPDDGIKNGTAPTERPKSTEGDQV